MAKVEWTKDLISNLIDNYETNPCLYDTKNKFYANKHARSDALLNITAELIKLDPRMEIDDVKKKLISLRQQFSHENSKILDSQRSGAGLDEIYEPSIWWFDKLSFLMPHVKSRKPKSSVDPLALTHTNSLETMSQMVELIYSNETSNSELTFPKTSIFKKRKLKQELNDAVIAETVKSLQEPDELKMPPTKSGNQIYGDYVASELETIKDEEIVTHLRHDINNLIYEAKTKWFKALKERRDND